MDKKIAITTTAIVRPDIIKKTFESFRFFFGGRKNKNNHLFINIDNIGGEKGDINRIISTCYDYFSFVNINFEKNKPNFSKAFKWCWDQVDETFDYVFNLEDDWVLTNKKLQIKKLVDIMEKNKDLASLRLSYKSTSGLKIKQWNQYFPYTNQGIYECPKHLIKNCGFCGHPSLLNAKFVRSVSHLIDTNLNPEKQFHALNNRIVDEVLKWRWGVYTMSMNEKKPLIEDIGRDWIKKSGFKKKGIKAFFTEYEKI